MYYIILNLCNQSIIFKFRSTPFNKTSAVFNVTVPYLSVAQAETNLIVTQGSKFSASFYLVDAISNMEIAHPDYKVILI